jgi:8-oxo-dGTP diphosphatase
MSVNTVGEGFQWRCGPVPSGLPVVQVYGWLFDDHGRVLVQRTPEGRFNLPGGSPEPGDADTGATLAREAAEESQVVIGDVAHLGYELWSRRGEDDVAMVRMVARITEFQPRGPDVDGGQLLARRMTRAARVPGLLCWGESGRAQSQDAGRLAQGVWGLPADRPTAPDGYVT